MPPKKSYKEILIPALNIYRRRAISTDPDILRYGGIQIHTDEAFLEKEQNYVLNGDAEEPYRLKDWKSGTILAVLQVDITDYIFYEDEEVVEITDPDGWHPMSARGKLTEKAHEFNLDSLLTIMRLLGYSSN